MLSTILIGCSTMKSFSPDNVISNVLAADNEVTYYGEMELSFQLKEETETFEAKEWRQNNKSRVEMVAEEEQIIALSDGESITVYNEEENSAIQLNSKELQNLHMNPKEQLEFLLDEIRDTHELEKVGNEKILNRDTFHLIAKKKDGEKTLYGDQELWIDTENWVVLKAIMKTSAFEMKMKYTAIDFNPKLDETTFVLDLPEDVEIEQLDDGELLEDEITLNDIETKLGKDVLYVPENREYEINAITYIDIDSDYKNVDIDYKRDGLAFATLSIVDTKEESSLEEQLVMFGDDAEEVTVRNQQGIFIDVGQLRALSWEEGNYSYSIDITNSNVTLDDILSFAENMEELKKGE